MHVITSTCWILITAFFLTSCVDEHLHLNELIEPEFTFAVIGDYGNAKRAPGPQNVARLVKSWDPEFIATLGDNNYSRGAASTIDQNIGQFYCEFIYPYYGTYCEGGPNKMNRFFPTLGDHDRIEENGNAYFDYFTLPNNEAYYDVRFDLVHLIFLDSNKRANTNHRSEQRKWAKSVITSSTAKWKLVLFHHSPYSSGKNGSTNLMRWDFNQWGISAVISAHDHMYERLDIDGVPYFVNGLGGTTIREFGDPLENSKVRFNDNHGAMKITISNDAMHFEFIDVDGNKIDQYSIKSITP